MNAASLLAALAADQDVAPKPAREAQMRASLCVAHALIQFGLWLCIAALIASRAESAEHVALPASAHAMRHLCVVGLFVGAAALVVVAGSRWRRS